MAAWTVGSKVDYSAAQMDYMWVEMMAVKRVVRRAARLVACWVVSLVVTWVDLSVVLKAENSVGYLVEAMVAR